MAVAMCYLPWHNDCQFILRSFLNKGGMFFLLSGAVDYVYVQVAQYYVI